MQGEDTLAALIAACHRALDELRRLDTAKLVGGGSGESLLYRWRSAESGSSEERCYVVRVVDGGVDEAVVISRVVKRHPEGDW